MKTHTTKKAIWARSLLLLPLLAILIYSCSTEEVQEIPLDENALENHSTYEENISEVPYAIITNNGIRDTVEVQVMFDFFKNPAAINHKQNESVKLNNDNLIISYDFFIKDQPRLRNGDTIADPDYVITKAQPFLLNMVEARAIKVEDPKIE